MRQISYLTKRNISLFLRDRLAVFFSFLSTIILVALYFLFIAAMFRQGMEQEGGSVLSDAAQNFLVYLQMMAGVLILNSMSLSMGVFSTIAKDFETKKVENFLITPLKRRNLLLSYLISGLIVAFSLNLITWFLSFILIGVITGYFVHITTFFLVLLILVTASAISCSIMLMVTALVHSSTAIGVIGGISGSLLGFLCGIYIPFSQLGTITVNVGSVIPFTHLTIWLKRAVLSDAFTQLSIPTNIGNTLMSEAFSAGDIGFVGLNIPLWGMMIYSGIFAFLCLIMAWVILSRRLKV